MHYTFYGIKSEVIRVFIFGMLFISLVSGCKKSTPELEVMDNLQEIVWKLNKNVEGLKNLAASCMASDSVAIFSIQYNEDKSVLYRVNMKKGWDVELFSEIVTRKAIIPELSMELFGEDFYWTINGSLLTDLNGNRVKVADDSQSLFFFLKDETICCRVADTIIEEYLVFTKASYLSRDVAFDYDVDNSVFKLRLSSGFCTMLPVVTGFRLLKENVKNQSYYKDIFLDAGIGLSSRKSLAAADYLKSSLEGVRFSRSNATEQEYALQDEIISGNSQDMNGRLLYPDGQPRFRLLFVNGGSSITHGQSLGEQGQENMRLFVQNGGSYVGTCAGAFLASNGYDGRSDYPYYLSLWPGIMQHTGLSNEYTGMSIEAQSPLLRYDDFGADYYVDSVRNNLGGYPVDLPMGTEVLARYDCPKIKDVHQKPSIWAYKENPQAGRLVLTGSHPEEIWSGERLSLTASMVQYALDGNGTIVMKGYLKNGVSRLMNKTTIDDDPDYTRIGDLQVHHFASYIPSDAKNVFVEVDSSSDCDLALMMSQDSYAFLNSAEFISSEPGPKQCLSFPSIREGLWYIAVQCLTTVTVEETDYGQAYSGNTEVLNGIPYCISISWE